MITYDQVREAWNKYQESEQEKRRLLIIYQQAATKCRQAIVDDIEQWNTDHDERDIAYANYLEAMAKFKEVRSVYQELRFSWFDVERKEWYNA